MSAKVAEVEIDPIHLLTKLVELEVRLQPIVQSVQKLEDVNEGTLRTRGIKEKIAIAEEQIITNKESFTKLEKEFKRLEIQIQDTLSAMSVNILRQFDEKVAVLLAAQKVSDADTQAAKTFIQKFQPWLNVAAWVVTVVAGLIITLLVGGKWYFGPTP